MMGVDRGLVRDCMIKCVLYRGEAFWKSSGP
jgi:hypothetical protein